MNRYPRAPRHSLLARLCLLAWALSLGSSCSWRGAKRTPGEAMALPSPARSYSSDPQPGGVKEGPLANQLEAEVVVALLARGEPPQPDGALGAVASWTLNELHEGRPLDLIRAAAAAHRFGFGGEPLLYSVFEAAAPSPWREHLQHAPSNVHISRYGVRVSPSGRWVSLVFGSMEGNYAAVPRLLRPGQSVAFEGRVGSRFDSCQVFWSKPDGGVEQREVSSRDFDVKVPFDQPGTYRLELLGDGATGPVVVANLPIFVGVPDSLGPAVVGAVTSSDAAEARLLVLLNEARAAAKLEPLAADAELRELALAHSTDMADHDFFGHVSPSTGTTTDRLNRSGVLVSFMGENVASADSAESIHQGLMDSPGHRVNILRPQFTHVGIGVKAARGGLLATFVFGRRPSPGSLPSGAPQVEAAIVDLRQRKGLPKAKPDALYRAAAAVGAAARAKGKSEDESNKLLEGALQREVDRHRTSRPATCVHYVELLELSQLEQLPPLLQSDLKRFGVGTSLLQDAKGTRLSTVLLLEGGERCK